VKKGLDLQVSSEARALHDDTLIVDLHCDTMLGQTFLGYDPTKRHRNRLWGSPFLFHADIPRMKEGGVAAVALGIVVSPLRRGSAAATTRKRLEMMAGWVEAAPEDVALAGTRDEILEARSSGRIALFGGLEGAHGLGGSLDELGELRELGLRYVTLAHFSQNEAATPSAGWGANPDTPLTDFGRELVEALNEHRILVDLAHVNRAGFLEACERSNAPVLVSHTGVAGAYDSWRNIDDEQLRAVARTGGVVAIIFAPVFLGPNMRGPVSLAVDHIRHVISVVGEDHVAVGSDFDGFIFPPTDLPDIAHLPVLTQCMLESGMTETQIRKCLGENTLRLFGDVCG